ncbi:hypothetical protein HDU98_000162 [Podochytrium sp. JEL0797]|nr:hypothetical protein HDU98_000162 [Podochytrium sp. JEL0797]
MFGQGVAEEEVFVESSTNEAAEALIKTTVQIEFGAEQVILVRNREDYEKLHARLGDGVLILTVEQSKGMEFEDVLIYSPFGSSPAGNGWRVFMGEIKGNREAFPAFSSDKHTILAVELKMLYVAITRARKRLWIFDSNEEARSPLFSLWKFKQLVTSITSTGNFSFTSIAQKSTPEAWRKNGKQFFERRQYEPALLCFRQEQRIKPTAQSLELCLLAEANMLRVQALRSALEDRIVESKKDFNAAAELYVKVGGRERLVTAAKCYERGDFMMQAAELFNQLEMFSEASKCYESIKKYLLASRCLEKLIAAPSTPPRNEAEIQSILLQALELHKLGFHFSDSIDLIKRHRALIPVAVVRRVVARASKFFEGKGNEVKKLEALSCLELDECAVILKIERNFETLAKMFTKHEEHTSAAEIWETEVHDLKRAEECYLREEDPEADARALDCCINRLWDLLMTSKKDWFLANDFSDTEKAETRDQITVWLDRVKQDPFAAFHADSVSFMRLNLEILGVVFSNESDCVSSLATLQNLVDVAKDVVDVGLQFRVHLVVVVELNRLLVKVDDDKIRLSMRSLQLHAAVQIKEVVEQLFKNGGANGARLLMQMESVLLVAPDANMPSLRIVPGYLKKETRLVFGDTEDEEGCSIGEAHIVIRSALLAMLIHWLPVLAEGVFLDWVHKRDCRSGLVTGCCSNVSCQDYHFGLELMFGGVMVESCKQIAELAIACREIAIRARLVSEPMHNLNVIRRRWVEVMLNALMPPDNPSNPRALKSEQESVVLSDTLKKGMKELAYSSWNRDVNPGSGCVVGYLLRAKDLFEVVFPDKRESLKQLGHLLSFWGIAPATMTKFMRVAHSTSIYEYLSTGLHFILSDVRGSMKTLSTLRLQAQRQVRGCILTFLESLITCLLLLEHPHIVLPFSWVLKVAQSFPGLDPSRLGMVRPMYRQQAFQAIELVAGQAEKSLLLRIGVLRTVLLQHDPKVWQPEVARPVATPSTLKAPEKAWALAAQPTTPTRVTASSALFDEEWPSIGGSDALMATAQTPMNPDAGKSVEGAGISGTSITATVDLESSIKAVSTETLDVADVSESEAASSTNPAPVTPPPGASLGLKPAPPPLTTNSLALRYVNLPSWTSGGPEIDGSPLTVLRNVIQNVSHDKLVLVTGMRPHLVKSAAWECVVAKLNLEMQVLDFVNARNKRWSVGSFLGLVCGLNPCAGEFVPGGGEKDSVVVEEGKEVADDFMEFSDSEDEEKLAETGGEETGVEEVDDEGQVPVVSAETLAAEFTEEELVEAAKKVVEIQKKAGGVAEEPDVVAAKPVVGAKKGGKSKETTKKEKKAKKSVKVVENAVDDGAVDKLVANLQKKELEDSAKPVIEAKAVIEDAETMVMKLKAVVVLQSWFRGILCRKLLLKGEAARRLQGWVRKVFAKRRAKTYNDVVFAEVLAGVRASWPSRFRFDVSISEHSLYRAWFLMNGPDIICDLSLSLEKMNPLCKLKKLVVDDDELDRQQEFISLQNKAKRMLADIRATSKKHAGFRLQQLKDMLASASGLSKEILARIRLDDRSSAAHISAGIKFKTVAVHARVVVADNEEEFELGALKGGKRGKKSKNW